MQIHPNYKLLLASTSALHGSNYLEYIIDEAACFFEADEILFIPFARPSGISFDDYTTKVKEAFEPKNIKVKGIHEFPNPIEAIQKAKGIYTGGGNTFLLLKTLYDLDLIEPLKQFAKEGKPYMGTSAGSNIAGPDIGTTNDMPIVYPPSFKSLNLFPLNINPHYLDADSNSTHKGETRETRIREFHFFNDQAVIGLREGSWLHIKNGEVFLKGNLTARLFQKGINPIEISPGIINL